MPDKINTNLGDVQKTLLLPLWGRAVETEKGSPLLVDMKAAEIVKRLDVDFAALGANQSPLTQAAWIMRSLLIDEVVRKFSAAHPQGTVVNIGCGLDTTFDRVDDGQMRWFDLDLPDVIALRKKLIAETDRRRFISASFLDETWEGQLQGAGSILFIAAGVFYYCSETEIRLFLSRAAERFPGCELIFDVSSPYGVKVANKKVIQRSGLDEKSFLKWGLKNPRVFTEWDARLQQLECIYYFGKKACKLPRNIRRIGFISDLLKVQYLVHLAARV